AKSTNLAIFITSKNFSLYIQKVVCRSGRMNEIRPKNSGRLPSPKQSANFPFFAKIFGTGQSLHSS
ncbi:MAG: hypothetical protein NZ781_10850, partial [Armatimonadetes bacterium]|nr:hypothetical protein [Armatimonadota bacterium]